MDSFWNAFDEYVRSYLPQWRYDPASGEAESALLLAAAELIEDSRSRLALLPQKQELAFLRGWALEPLDADPAHAYAALTAPEGRFVPEGTELYLSGDGGRLWRTAEDAQAEPAQLEEQFLTGGGRLIPLPSPAPGRPVRLFDLRPDSLPGPEVQFSHPDALSSPHGCQVELILPQASRQLLELFAHGDSVRWSLAGPSGGAVPLPSPALTEHGLRFQLPAAPDGLALRVSLPPADLPADPIGPVSLRAQRRELPPDLVWDGDGVHTGAHWLPFGEVPQPWRACCLSCPGALALRGARLTVRFTLSMREQEDLLPGMEEAPEYRPIMRRLPAPPPPIREVWADQVLWEYWNGLSWLPIPGTEKYAGVFAAREKGVTQVEAQFRWPEDAAPCQMGGQTHLWLRWRIGRAENSGWLPRRCHAPEVDSLRFSALLEGAPVSVSVRNQAEKEFHPLDGPRSPLFHPAAPGGSRWWLGFDRPPSGRLLRLYLSLQNRVPGGALTAWEAVESGRERPLTLEDGTDGLSHSGVITIREAQGRLSTRFGLRRWWLCLRDGSGRLARGRHFPCLLELACGAVRLRVENGGPCRSGEPLSPLRGGTLRGVTLTQGFGGSEAEDQAALLRRARALRHYQGRCVSAADVDQLLRAQLRDVLRTRCVREGDTLSVAVLMRDIACHEAAFAMRKEEICRLLERTSALPALGLRVAAREPVFYPVSATVWLHPAEGTSADAVGRAAREALERFLNPAKGHFQGRGWQIGCLPTEMEVRNYLQANLPGAAIVKLLLTAAAPDGRELDCAQVKDPFSVPLSGSHTVHLLQKEGALWNP